MIKAIAFVELSVISVFFHSLRAILVVSYRSDDALFLVEICFSSGFFESNMIYDSNGMYMLSLSGVDLYFFNAVEYFSASLLKFLD